MNTQEHRFPVDRDWRRRAEIYRYLEEIGQDLDLTEAQIEKARREHDKLCNWLATALEPLLIEIIVYAHGSFALGTANKPLGRAEFDIDLICLLKRGHAGLDPASIKRLIGNRLKESSEYRHILEEKKRCWRLNFPGDFHIDVAVTIPNPSCVNNGELVPDKALKAWHPTNPQGFKVLFEKRAALEPRFKRSFVGLSTVDAAAAQIEPFPEQSKLKGVLRRLVQLLKRHRDYHFLDIEQDVAPISVIITTLAMRSYEHCVGWYTFGDELELLVEVIRMMPHFIDTDTKDGRTTYAVWNETTIGENFADRWNAEPERVNAFYAWHKKALSDFEAVRDAVGLDAVIGGAREQFGHRVVDRVMAKRNKSVSDARKSNGLLVAPAIGLTTSRAASASVSIPNNDFFGE
ncbi:nucleotidyltransferase [Hoeflea sp.]|uniref:nucleotidyltransferase domain-containing protein n=1 Tax=Hoeflea sp. TaxID=1940281 RepID=UPI003A91AB8A